MPPELGKAGSEQDLAAYRAQVQALARPYGEQAVEACSAATRVARDHRVDTEWSRKAAELLEQERQRQERAGGRDEGASHDGAPHGAGRARARGFRGRATRPEGGSAGREEGAPARRGGGPGQGATSLGPAHHAAEPRHPAAGEPEVVRAAHRRGARPGAVPGTAGEVTDGGSARRSSSRPCVVATSGGRLRILSACIAGSLVVHLLGWAWLASMREPVRRPVPSGYMMVEQWQALPPPLRPAPDGEAGRSAGPPAAPAGGAPARPAPRAVRAPTPASAGEIQRKGFLRALESVGRGPITKGLPGTIASADAPSGLPDASGAGTPSAGLPSRRGGGAAAPAVAAAPGPGGGLGGFGTGVGKGGVGTGGGVLLGAGTVDSAEVDQARLDAFVRARIGGLRACYETELRIDPRRGGTVRVRFVIRTTRRGLRRGRGPGWSRFGRDGRLPRTDPPDLDHRRSGRRWPCRWSIRSSSGPWVGDARPSVRPGSARREIARRRSFPPSVYFFFAFSSLMATAST